VVYITGLSLLPITFWGFAMVGNQSTNLQFCTNVEPKNYR